MMIMVMMPRQCLPNLLWSGLPPSNSSTPVVFYPFGLSGIELRESKLAQEAGRRLVSVSSSAKDQLAFFPSLALPQPECDGRELIRQ